ncbi:cell envelope integrity protein CreD [Flavobacterium beibuense]|uniref:Inner membrane protein CreD n=1 Tax=Flavobacterium beibuense TaxID=657326 RepID=A0A444WEQ2_9FLAO|nr:cell envelope integrity protein CreD [Flavobacterium beibuense]RYJ44331.1 Inner membrane protein CreD [Flavobacterium beibuense]
MMEQNLNTTENTQKPQGFFQSNTAKIIMVGLLTLILLIPLQFVKSLIFERSQRQKEVVEEINQKWGGSVSFYGPILKVPYTIYDETRVENEKTKQVTYERTPYTEYAYFFPDELKSNIDVDVDSDSKKRSIYKSVVYTSKLNFKGNYSLPDFSSKKIDAQNINWDQATILIRTTNIKGIQGGVHIKVGDKTLTFEPTAQLSTASNTSDLETSPMDIRELFKDEKTVFNFDIEYHGSENISIVPIGKQTEATMNSNWHSPSFKGNFLPKTGTVEGQSFPAHWSISYLNRPFTQQYFGTLPNLSDYTFETGFIIPVDEYQQSERAAKYGFLVIGLTFLVFFLIQTISKVSIHIFQYGMIGLALIMFYTLLISITEHSSFMLGYVIAAVAVVVMIGLYSLSILKNAKFPLFIAISLSALYSFIYVIIQLEDYALLVGSIGLFLILGAIMYFSRKIDWNNSTAQTANA